MYTLRNFYYYDLIVRGPRKHVTGGHAQGVGAKPCMYKHCGGAKTLLCYANHKVTGSAGRGENHLKFFIWGQCPCSPYSYVSGCKNKELLERLWGRLLIKRACIVLIYDINHTLPANLTTS